MAILPVKLSDRRNYHDPATTTHDRGSATVHDLAAETQEAYVRAVKQLAQHYACTCGAVQVSQVA
jgi:hypothetical protein